MIEAMTEGGFKKGTLFAPRDALEEIRLSQICDGLR